MKNIALWLWCLPQNVLGLLLIPFSGARHCGDHYKYQIKSGSVSLGEYVFLCPSHWDDEITLKHERGHQIQSHLLGWLYLPVIGLPSLVWASCFEKYRKRNNISYYSFYTEKWADQLGGVNRTRS